MKILLLSILIFSVNLKELAAQEEQRSQVLVSPDSWRYEKLDLPLSFAPEIKIEGFEEVRFAPGWSKQESEQFWTYTFVWVLESPATFTREEMEKNLKHYFDGLMSLVGKIDSVGTEASLQQEEFGFSGQVETYDTFFIKDRVLLNLTIEHNQDLSLWQFRLSPKETSHPVWQQLNSIKAKSN